MAHATPDISLDALERVLGYTFADKALLVQALTHPSFAYESRQKDTVSNQRLEFLGDSILGMVVAENLYHEYPSFAEGDLTRHRSLLVNKSALYACAQTLELSHYMRVGKGEEKTGGRMNATNLSGALEAVIGAIYLDGGIDAARRFIVRVVVGRGR